MTRHDFAVIVVFFTYYLNSNAMGILGIYFLRALRENRPEYKIPRKKKLRERLQSNPESKQQKHSGILNMYVFIALDYVCCNSRCVFS